MSYILYSILITCMIVYIFISSWILYFILIVFILLSFCFSFNNFHWTFTSLILSSALSCVTIQSQKFLISYMVFSYFLAFPLAFHENFHLSVWIPHMTMYVFFTLDPTWFNILIMVILKSPSNIFNIMICLWVYFFIVYFIYCSVLLPWVILLHFVFVKSHNF